MRKKRGREREREREKERERERERENRDEEFVKDALTFSYSYTLERSKINYTWFESLKIYMP
jgi:hypothetical protein